MPEGAPGESTINKYLRYKPTMEAQEDMFTFCSARSFDVDSSIQQLFGFFFPFAGTLPCGHQQNNRLVQSRAIRRYGSAFSCKYAKDTHCTILHIDIGGYILFAKLFTLSIILMHIIGCYYPLCKTLKNNMHQYGRKIQKNSARCIFAYFAYFDYWQLATCKICKICNKLCTTLAKLASDKTS
jgi:hypothetical protein